MNDQLRFCGSPILSDPTISPWIDEAKTLADSLEALLIHLLQTELELVFDVKLHAVYFLLSCSLFSKVKAGHV